MIASSDLSFFLKSVVITVINYLLFFLGYVRIKSLSLNQNI